MRSIKLLSDIDKFHDEELRELCNLSLLFRFYHILYQCKQEDKDDRVLLKYINELEFRRFEYSIN